MTLDDCDINISNLQYSIEVLRAQAQQEQKMKHTKWIDPVYCKAIENLEAHLNAQKILLVRLQTVGK